jgi:hypothetical protein
LYERPLIAVTCGDIGTDPDVLEDKLEDVFRRAEEWGAVLLLDEADVFLAERNLESLERNALVSSTSTAISVTVLLISSQSFFGH